MRFAVQIFAIAALFSAALAAPAADPASVQVRDAKAEAAGVCYCYGGFCTPGCRK
ncbi:hypothetical protein PtrSN002B_009454 [Pyrenophora tritici-repentis]|uniref:Uncharacterized protein n=2 Tax=Pyrenophora tritici-repentis TaxID=45151 RepID=A0A2W1H197_9PLEO|nr:uncharacterized protein PTRG_10147 [Pyrenophora tritici-repentis Pt-1C-BFP]KAA8620747.1 hypothetical protein PtrV1_05248 [Pyrenophora tritici-repentis]EDU43198.1 hypothetical protein PTRG_10147 [Pyrenophora tritici-repentis Pt-1C-BFP]KAF7449993.1 hypothetical protein A1F99_046090 [Pyrenophora tritici-repentis]KAF7572560.1 hypothetical protein PtrM4_074650 [Pyrenophora tritici-repentis]KAG9375958.1 hypothetical protein A1F94_013224 [Pyrenophora tritici-repentis]